MYNMYFDITEPIKRLFRQGEGWNYEAHSCGWCHTHNTVCRKCTILPYCRKL